MAGEATTMTPALMSVSRALVRVFTDEVRTADPGADRHVLGRGRLLDAFGVRRPTL